jgi:hypothetical protein
MDLSWLSDAAYLTGVGIFLSFLVMVILVSLFEE